MIDKFNSLLGFRMIQSSEYDYTYVGGVIIQEADDCG